MACTLPLARYRCCSLLCVALPLLCCTHPTVTLTYTHTGAVLLLFYSPQVALLAQRFPLLVPGLRMEVLVALAPQVTNRVQLEELASGVATRLVLPRYQVHTLQRRLADVAGPGNNKKSNNNKGTTKR